MSRTDDTADHSAAYATNWRTVLAVDAAVGFVALIVGSVLAFIVTLVGGAVLAAAGAGYTALIAIRARRWVRLRRQAGL